MLCSVNYKGSFLNMETTASYMFVERYKKFGVFILLWCLEKGKIALEGLTYHQIKLLCAN